MKTIITERLILRPLRLRDAENNMIGQNGIAGPVANQFTVK